MNKQRVRHLRSESSVMIMKKYVGNDVGKRMFMQIVKITQKKGCKLALLEGKSCIGVNWIIPN